MAEFKPSTSKEDLVMVEKELAKVVEILAGKKARLALNKYSGKYAGLFAELYSEIYDIVFVVQDQFQDGFQWSDVSDLIEDAFPEFMELYDTLQNDFYDVVPEEDYEEFFGELIKFMYFEVIDLVKIPGWIKGLFGWLLRRIAAKKGGKLLADLFLYLEGKVEDVEVNDTVKTIANVIRSIWDGLND